MTSNTETARSNRLLMIGLDAGEFTLIRKWMAQGILPNLSALLKRGRSTLLEPTPDWMVGSLWPSFYTSDTTEQFGVYHYLVWRPDTMTTERPEPGWMPLDPFWRHLHEQDRRVIVVDIPLCYPPAAYPGVEVSGWANHDLLQAPGSSPPGLLHEIRRDFGKAPFREETAFQLTVAECLEVRDECIATAGRVAEVGRMLMQKHPWDLSLVCFSSVHRAGHVLWDRTILKGTPTPAELEAFDQSLRDVYVACDAAVGRLVEQVGDQTAVMVFALHGMGPNSDRTNILPEMLQRILEDRTSDGEPIRKGRFSEQLRQLIPEHWRARIKHRLPQWLKDKLTVYWRSDGLDWSRTRAFAAFCDLDGYVRINLRGRERDGIVPVEEYGPLCERIADGLRTWHDADTGAALVREIAFTEQTRAPGPMRKHLPDLIVRWIDTPAASHRRLVSERYGSILWRTPGRHPSGRAGNHRRNGFLITAGGAFEGGQIATKGSIVDLAPTAMQVLELPKPASFRGNSLLSGTS
jgi:predicted AlkP superfamily phosphohydrolase/phosphomutase